MNASIRWPSGLVQQLQDLPINHRAWVDEGVTPSRVEAFKQFSPFPRSRRKPLKFFPRPLKHGCSCPFLRPMSRFPRQARSPPNNIRSATPGDVRQRRRGGRLQCSLSLSVRPAPRSHSAGILLDRRAGKHRQGLPGSRQSEAYRRRLRAHPTKHRGSARQGTALPRQCRDI